MQRVLFVETEARRGSRRRQAAALAAGLEGLGCRVKRVAVPQRWFDLRQWRSFASALSEFRPETVHLLGPCTGLWTRWLVRRAARAPIFIQPLPVVVRQRVAMLSTEEARFRLGIPPHFPVIAILARLEADRGVKDAIWAFDILRYLHPQLQLLIAGEGPERDNLRQFIRALGAERNARLLGWRNDAETLLQSADLVWVPGRHRDPPLAAAEALAAGKPVVAAQCPATEEIVEEGVSGIFFRSGDKTRLAQLSHRLLADADWRRRIGGQGRVAATARYGIQYAARILLDQYRQLLVAQDRAA